MQQLGCFGFSGVEEASLGGLQCVPCGVSSGFWPILYVSWSVYVSSSGILSCSYTCCIVFQVFTGSLFVPQCDHHACESLRLYSSVPGMDDVCIILMHASTFMFYFSSPSARGLYFFLSPAPRVLYIFLSPDSRGLYFFCPQSFRAITFFSFLAVIFWSLFICGYSSGHYTFLSGHWVIIAHQYLFFWSSLPRHAPLNVISGCSERPFS